MTVEKTVFGPEVDDAARAAAKVYAAEVARRLADLVNEEAALRRSLTAGRDMVENLTSGGK